jgi:hypothetical protein
LSEEGSTAGFSTVVFYYETLEDGKNPRENG